jgi:F5/8 type C domain
LYSIENLEKASHTIRLVKKSGTTMLVDAFAVSSAAAVSNNVLPHSRMTATATSSQNQGADGPATNAIDDNTITLWHSQYSPMQALPQSLTLNLGGFYSVSQVKYLPRQGGGNGNCTAYNIYTSTNGVNFTLRTSGAMTNDATQKTVSFTAVTASYVKFEITAGFNGYASCGELNIVGEAVTAALTIPHGGMTAMCTSNQGGTEDIANIIDNYASTFWHSMYSPSVDALPISLTLALGGRYRVREVRYLPRPDGGNGVITGYTISTSTDGDNFTQVASGTWADDASEKTATFTSTSASYVRLTATSGHGGYASCAELNVLVDRAPSSGTVIIIY